MTGACGSLAARAHTQHVPASPLPARLSHSITALSIACWSDTTLLSRDQCSLRGTEGREGSRRTSILLLSVSARRLPGASPTRSCLLSWPPGSARDRRGTIHICSVRPSGLDLEARGHATCAKASIELAGDSSGPGWEAHGEASREKSPHQGPEPACGALPVPAPSHRLESWRAWRRAPPVGEDGVWAPPTSWPLGRSKPGH